MASIEETIKIIFGAEDNTGGVISGLQRNFDGFDASLQKIAKPAADFTKSLLSVELAVAGVGVALAGVAIKEASQFQTSFNEISTLFNDTGDATNQFSKDILNYATTSTQSIESINKAIYNTISAGVSYKDSIEFVAKAEQLAVAGKTDLNDAANILISTLNAYGKSTKDAADFSDALFQAVKSGKTTLPELANSLSQVTGAAVTAGIPFTELLAAIAALTANGAPTAQAITGVRAAINAILQPSKEASDLAKELGLAFDANALKSKGLHGVLKDVQAATNGNTTQFTTLFGAIEAFGAASILAADRSGSFANNLVAMADRAGATQAAFDKMRGNFDLLAGNIQNNVKIIAIEIGTNFIKAFGDLPGLISDAFKALHGTDAFKPFLDALNTFAASAQDTLSKIVKNLPAALDKLDFSKLIAAFGKLGDEIGQAFGDIFGNIDVTTVDGLTAALQRGVDIITGFVNVTTNIVDQFDPIFKLIGRLGDEIAKDQNSLSEKTGKLLGVLTVIGEFGSAFGGALVLIKNSGVDIKAAFEAIASGARLLFNLLQTGFAAIAIVIAESLEAINKGFALVTFGDVSKNFKKASEVWGSFSESFKEKITEDVKDVGDSWSSLNDAFSRLDASGAKKASSELGELKKSADGARQKVGELSASLLNQDATVENIAKAVDEYGNNFKVVDGKIVPTLEKVDAALKKTGDATLAADKKHQAWTKSVVDGVTTYDQFGARAPAAVDKVTKATEKAKTESEKLKDKLDEIASKERIAIIEAKVKLDIAGLEAQTKQVHDAFESLNTTIKSTGDIIGVSLGALKDITGFYGLEKLDILTKQLASENALRQQAIDQQGRLTDAQIRLLDARADAVSRGDGQIKIDGAGLQPHLEAFMFEILKAIRVQANKDGENFLLGLT